MDAARRNGMSVAVRSGCHSGAGNRTCEGEMVIEFHAIDPRFVHILQSWVADITRQAESAGRR